MLEKIQRRATKLILGSRYLLGTDSTTERSKI